MTTTDIDLTYYTAGQMEGLAQKALAIVSDMRECDTQELHQLLAVECHTAPNKAAQLIQCLALFVNDRTTYRSLVNQVQWISQPRNQEKSA